MQKIFIIGLLLLIILIIFYSSVNEGFTPGESNNPGESKTPTKVSLSTADSLTKFMDALSSAFSPPAAPPSVITADPSWKKANENTKMKKNKETTSCVNSVQVALNPLPIDQQTTDLINKHSLNVKNMLDTYDKKLAIIETILANNKKILALNKNIDAVSNLALPTATINYDENMNSLLNLSVVTGEQGPIGTQGISQQGRGITGKRGSIGIDGTNPSILSGPVTELPYWSK